MEEPPAEPRRLVVGRIVGVHGVRGWVKVESWTQPRENLFGFERWWLEADGASHGAYRLVDGRPQGKGLVAALEGVDERECARGLIGSDILVPRAALPPSEEGRYYWADLEGLRVETVAGDELGGVSHLFETGANDVLVVRGERERLIPFVPDVYVVSVDLAAGVIRVDWDPDF